MTNSPEPTAREQLLYLQRESFVRLEDEIRSYQKREGRALRLFRQKYLREVESYRRVSSKQELLESVEKSDIVYCGDFHTLGQAQRSVIRILEPISKTTRKIAIGLELVPKAFEKIANDFVANKISEEQFLKELDYQNRWGFPWKNYKQIFDFARRNNIQMIGLSSNFSDKLPLEARDDLAADFIVEATISYPDHLLFCLYGDLHFAEPHIPKKVRLRMDRHGLKKKFATIFQNSDAIYWKLAGNGLEDSVDVVEIAKSKYCVISAAPWIKWQSYKSWIEDHTHLLDDPFNEEDDLVQTQDYYHQVFELAERISTFLKLDPQDLDHFTVMTAMDVTMIDVLEKYFAHRSKTQPNIRALLRTEIVENRSGYLPEAHVLYLSDLSENRAAEKAAQLIATKLLKINDSWVYQNPSDAKELFYRLALWEAIGFFGSKVINPKRKCDYYKDFQNLIERTRKQRLRGTLRDLREAAKQLLAHRTYELKQLKTRKSKGAPRRLYRLPPRQFFLAASQLGKILADRLYRAIMSEKLQLAPARVLFSPLEGSSAVAQTRYFELLKMLQQEAVDQQSKEDHF